MNRFIKVSRILDQRIEVTKPLSNSLAKIVKEKDEAFTLLKEKAGSYVAKNIFNSSDDEGPGVLKERTTTWTLEFLVKIPRDIVAPVAFCIPGFTSSDAYVNSFDFRGRGRFEKLFAQDSFLMTNLIFLLSATKSTTANCLDEGDAFNQVQNLSMQVPWRLFDFAHMMCAVNDVSNLFLSVPEVGFSQKIPVIKEQSKIALADTAARSLTFYDTKDGVLLEFNFKSSFPAGYDMQHLTDNLLSIRPLAPVSIQDIEKNGHTVESFKKAWQNLFESMWNYNGQVPLELTTELPATPLAFKK